MADSSHNLSIKQLIATKYMTLVVLLGGIDETSKTTTQLIATIPFQFESIEKIRRAKEVLEECRERFDEVVVLDNQDLFSQVDEKITFKKETEITATATKNYVLNLIRK